MTYGRIRVSTTARRTNSVAITSPPTREPSSSSKWSETHQAGHKLAVAIRYALSLWVALTRYSGDGRLEIDNNAAERALRAIALGRKNYLFAGSTLAVSTPPRSTV